MSEFLDILSYPGSTGSATRYALRIFRLHRRHAWMEPTTDACIACMADLAMVYSTFIVPWLNFLLFICLLLKYCWWFWNHFFSYLSIHSHTRPVHAAKLRSPQCVFSLWRAAGKTRSGMDRCGVSDLERSECPLTGDVPVREVRQCYHQPWLKWCLFIEAD